MLLAVQIVCMLSGIVLITAVVMQTTKADGFSAAMGGSADASRFRKGSKEDLLEKVTKASAVVWLVFMVIAAVLWYHGR